MSTAGPIPPNGGSPRQGGRSVPPSWLIPAVVATLCCFAPTGIVSVYFAAQVNAYWEKGDSRAAVKASRRARTWLVVSLLLWAASMLFLVATGRLGMLLESGVIEGS